MNIIIKPSIFDNTILHDLNFSMKWNDHRPDTLYQVKDTIITLNNYAGWYNIKYYNDIKWLRCMFMHDIGHCLLYISRNEDYKIFTDDFGLTWDDTHMQGDKLIFHNLSHLLDEYKIIAIENILDNEFNGNHYNKDDLIDKIYNITRHMRYNKDNYNDISISYIKDAVLYWITETDNYKNKIYDTIDKLRNLLNIYFNKEC